MQNRLWLFGVGFLAVVFAYLLLPKPDTGPQLERNGAPTPAVAAQEATPGDATRREGAVALRPGTIDPRTARIAPGDRLAFPREGRPSPLSHIRNSPDGIYLGQIASPWTSIRYRLLKMDGPDAAMYAERLRPILPELATKRRKPDEGRSIEQIEAALEDIADGILSSDLADEASIAEQLVRFDDMQRTRQQSNDHHE